MNLAEKYRPTTLAEIIGQEKAISLINDLLPQEEIAIWLEGNVGVGKSVVADCIAEAKKPMKPDDFIKIYSHELKQSVQGEIELRMMGKPTGRSRLLIVEDAQFLSAKAGKKLLPLLESLPAKTWIIFCSWKAIDDLWPDDPQLRKSFKANVKKVRLTNQGLAPKYAQRAKEIAEAEGLGGKADVEYSKLLKRCGNDMRKIFREIEAGAMKA